MAATAPNGRWPRALGLVAVAAGLLPMLLLAGAMPIWAMLACVILLFAGSALLCGAWEFLRIRRREARSRGFDAQSHGVIVASEIGNAYSDTSPLMNLTVLFKDQRGVEQRALVQKVVMLNELALYAVGQPVLVRFASTSPTADLVIAPLVASARFSL